MDIEPRLLHHDLQPGDLVRPAAGGSLLLDWELAAFSDPLSDLARLAVRLT
ncbi:phosphotransferase [Streptomyces sp. NPDC004435]|uniref:phosphotransferase n=1 Tax=Streptomyces sp. NPDC004435 TaxID=3364701 RepID=UPI0036AF2047